MILLLLLLMGCARKKTYMQAYRIYKTRFIRNKLLDKDGGEKSIMDFIELGLTLKGEEKLKCMVLECQLAAHKGYTEQVEYLFNRIRNEYPNHKVIPLLKFCRAISYLNPYELHSTSGGLPDNYEKAIKVWKDLEQYDEYRDLSIKVTDTIKKMIEQNNKNLILEQFNRGDYVSCLYRIQEAKMKDAIISNIYKQCIKKLKI